MEWRRQLFSDHGTLGVSSLVMTLSPLEPGLLVAHGLTQHSLSLSLSLSAFHPGLSLGLQEAGGPQATCVSSPHPTGGVSVCSRSTVAA